MQTKRNPWILAGILLLTLLVLAAGTWLITRYFFASTFGWPSGRMGPAWSRGDRSYDSNGAQIYFSATSGSGPPVTFEMQDGPGMPMMHSQLACVDCHGENGQGGSVRMMMMGQFEAPSIQYEHLTEGEHGEGEAEHPPYTEETLKQAITEGLNPAGEPLEWPMPRWKMTDEQLNDLIAFLKTLH